jgi:hypothetical protein|nr:MAG TPA: hypothetical protein [Caudoviricetes sp.]
MYYRCELLAGGNVHDVTNDLVNWDDVEMSFKRNDYDGVVRSFSTKFEFSGGAYSLLLREYQSNYLNSSATIVFYVRNNSWLLNEKFRCALDYSTFTYTDISCEINAVDNSLASLIKAKKGTQYEYLVSELKEAEPLYYDRLEMSSNINFIITGDTDDEYISNSFAPTNESLPTYYSYPLYISGNPEISKKDIIEIYDVPKKDYGNTTATIPFIKNISNSGLKLNINIKLTLNVSLNNGRAWLIIGQKGLSNSEILNKQLSEGDNVIEINRTDYLLFGNDSFLYFSINVRDATCVIRQQVLDKSNLFNITFMARNDAIDIDCIRPNVLLTRLLRTITGDNSVIGEITNTTDARLDKTVIAPAESIRGIPNAKIYTSYTKFANWMSSVFGFVPVIGDNKVTFVHRDALFQDKLVKDLKDDTVDLNYNVSSSMIYSRLKVGYDKQDYDSVNGRDEFHFTNEYTTGITLTENAKELISPYRADAYGIEFLAAKRGEDTTDNDSDSDIFFVGASLEGGKYKLVRSGYTISGVISPSTMFNAMYSQRYMIEANARYLAAFAEQLSFTSSDGNSDVEINGVRETNDIALGNRLFTVGELSVETGDQGTPSDLSGYIRIEKNGNVYKGFVKSVSYNHGKAKPVKYSLIVKSVE